MCSRCYNDITKVNQDICGLCSKYLLEGTLEKIKFGRVCHYTCVKNFLVQKDNQCFCESIHHEDKEETFPISNMWRIANENGITQYFCQTCYSKGQQNYEMCKRCHNYLPIEQIMGELCFGCQPLPPIPVSEEPLPIPLPLEYGMNSNTLPSNYVSNPSVNPLVTRPPPISSLTDRAVSFPVVLEDPPTPVMFDEPHLLDENTINCPNCSVPIFKNILICPHCSFDLKKKKLFGRVFGKKEKVLKGILKSNQREICKEKRCNEIVAHQGRCIKHFRDFIDKKGKCRVCGKSKLGEKKNNHEYCTTIHFNKKGPKEFSIENLKDYNKQVKVRRRRAPMCSYCDETLHVLENFVTLYNREEIYNETILFYVHQNCYPRFCETNPELIQQLRLGKLMMGR